MSKKSSDDCTFAGLPSPIDDTLARMLEHLHGRAKADGLHDCEGATLNLQAALVRGYRTDRFQLAVKLGPHWYGLLSVAPEDAAIEGMEVTRIAPAPHELARRQREAERERQAREDEARRDEERRHAQEQRRAERQERKHRLHEEAKRRWPELQNG